MSSKIYINLQSFQAYISPPIASVFILGIFWKKANSRGAIWALISGGFLGLVRLILDLIGPTAMSNNTILNYYCNINYLHFAFYLFVFTIFVQVAVSYIFYDETLTQNILHSVCHSDNRNPYHETSKRHIFLEFFYRSVHIFEYFFSLWFHLEIRLWELQNTSIDFLFHLDDSEFLFDWREKREQPNSVN